MYAEAYEKTLEEMERLALDSNKLARTNGLTTLLAAGDLLKNISSTNLIVESGESGFAVSLGGR